MRRSSLVLGLAAAASALTFVGEREAAACGGCFHPPTQTVTDITDERMLLSVSHDADDALRPDSSTRGNPTSFAWVLPIHGTVTVGLSADVLFDSIDALTATQINRPRTRLPGAPAARLQRFASARRGSPAAAAADAVLPPPRHGHRDQAAERRPVRDRPAPLDRRERARTTGSRRTASSSRRRVQPVIAAYVTEGFDFLAMKLLPNQGVQAMRPVRVTMPGASLSLPLAHGRRSAPAPPSASRSGSSSDGRYEPQNFPFFHIDDSQLVWDWSTSSSNYTTLRAQNEAALGGKGWEIESSITLNRAAHLERHPERRPVLPVRRLRRASRLRTRARTTSRSGPPDDGLDAGDRRQRRLTSRRTTCAPTTSPRSSPESAARTPASPACAATSRTPR